MKDRDMLRYPDENDWHECKKEIHSDISNVVELWHSSTVVLVYGEEV